eukprot:CAMPEP_0173088440 /NCGR_PEP_ID=MMETSP1102-20130122/24944_1 /TAXON_ID=49646 /ORGANISM="Geminigera sp., Strain Caron Lab Isolate" /LENGTH=96 /DNA_ID=CAMNT_0013971361 /DNA_START=952 /DNA_END=1239 /DNA_ORIENTATION=+
MSLVPFVVVWAPSTSASGQQALALLAHASVPKAGGPQSTQSSAGTCAAAGALRCERGTKAITWPSSPTMAAGILRIMLAGFRDRSEKLPSLLLSWT